MRRVRPVSQRARIEASRTHSSERVTYSPCSLTSRFASGLEAPSDPSSDVRSSGARRAPATELGSWPCLGRSCSPPSAPMPTLRGARAGRQTRGVSLSHGRNTLWVSRRQLFLCARSDSRVVVGRFRFPCKAAVADQGTFLHARMGQRSDLRYRFASKAGARLLRARARIGSLCQPQ